MRVVSTKGAARVRYPRQSWMRVYPLVRTGAFGALMAMAVGCTRCNDKPRVVLDAGQDAALVAPFSLLSAPIDAGADAGNPDAGNPDAGPAANRARDVGQSTCKLLQGPELMPFRGPAALAMHGTYLDLLLNDHGTPRSHRVPILPIKPARTATSKTTLLATTPQAYNWPGCVQAQQDTYCVGAVAPSSCTAAGRYVRSATPK